VLATFAQDLWRQVSNLGFDDRDFSGFLGICLTSSPNRSKIAAIYAMRESRGCIRNSIELPALWPAEPNASVTRRRKEVYTCDLVLDFRCLQLSPPWW